MMTTVYPCDTGVITNAAEEIKLGFSISSYKIKKREGGIFRTKALNNNKSNFLEQHFFYIS